MAFEKIISKLTPANGEKPSELGRNEPCHCGSGKKYKKCHLPQDQEAKHKQLLKAEIPPLPADKEEAGDKSARSKRPSAADGRAAAPKTAGGFVRALFNRKSGES